jgi:thioredoxin reductase (NADPH)
MMKQPNVAVYGSKGCGDTIRAMRFLDDRQIAYEFKDVDQSPELNDYIADLNNGKRVMPTIQIDNEILVNPSERELKRVCQQAAAERP